MRNSNPFDSRGGGQGSSARRPSEANSYLLEDEGYVASSAADADDRPYEEDMPAGYDLAYGDDLADGDKIDDRPRPRPSGKPAARSARTARLPVSRPTPYKKGALSTNSAVRRDDEPDDEFEEELEDLPDHEELHDDLDDEADDIDWADEEDTEPEDEEPEWEPDVRRPGRRRRDHSHPFRATGETVIFSINPAFHPVAMGYIVSSFISLAIAAILSFFHVSLWVVFGAAIIAFIPSIIKHIRHVHTVFTLTTIKLEISEGLFSKTTRNIPLRHIQDVSVRENFKERMMGIGDIIVDNAAIDSSLILSNVNDPRQYSDLILEQLERWN
jgi:membrane protein YdbS with pleckstrin-like domain